MKTEMQRIAIAEACGWKGVDSRRWGGYTDIYQPLCSPSDAVGAPAKYWGYIPDYFNDLNAMHEAEKVLGDDEATWHGYKFWLLSVIEPRRHVIHATAAQKAEAFLKTLNLWTP